MTRDFRDEAKNGVICFRKVGNYGKISYGTADDPALPERRLSMRQVIRGLLLALIIFCLCAPSALAFNRDRSLPDPSPFIQVPSAATPEIPGDANDIGWTEIGTTSTVSPPGGGEQVIPASTGTKSSLTVTLIRLVWDDLTKIVVTGVSNLSF